MEKKTIIWHPNTDLPIEDDKDIIFYTRTGDRAVGYYYNGSFCSSLDTEYNWCFEPKHITKWAYFDQVIATSKALDVAIDSLDAIKDWDADNPKEPFHMRPYQVRAIQNFAHNKSKEINRIMKGCK